jgi:hypothetical protein
MLCSSVHTIYHVYNADLQCIDKADDSKIVSTTQAKTCDLTPTQLILGFAAVLSSTSMLGMKIVNVKLIRSLWNEDEKLKLEREALLAELHQSLSTDAEMAEKVGKVVRRLSMAGGPIKRDASVPAMNRAVTAASPPVLPRPQKAPTIHAAGPEFVTARDGPPSMRTATLATVNVQPEPTAAATPAAAAKHARKRGTDAIGQTRAERAEPSDDRPTVRGQCPACERPVFSTDDGRFSLRGTYYHAECVKGPCGRCGNQVLGDQDRSKLGNVYFHTAPCPPPSFYT